MDKRKRICIAQLQVLPRGKLILHGVESLYQKMS